MEPKRFKIAGTLLRATLASVAVFAAATMPANADSAASDASTTIKIGIYPGNISSTPWIVADEKGFFAEQGLKADIIKFNNGPALAAGVVSGSVDVAYGASSVSFDVARQSSKLLVLNDFAEFINWQVIVIKDKATSSATAGFPENVKSLKGLRIGLPSLGGVVNKFVVALLKAGGLSTDDVTIIAVGAPNTAVPALKNGRVDALAAVVSLQDLQRQGMEGVTVVDAGIPGNAGSTMTDVLGVIDTTSRAFMEKDPATLNKYCKAMTKAITWMKDPANRDAAADVLAKQVGISKDLALEELHDSLPAFHDSVPESVWNSQPDWITGGGDDIPTYKDTVYASCGR